MYLPLKKFKEGNIFNKNFFLNMALYIKSVQLKSGAIPSNFDGSHDPWDHIESIIGLNFAKEKKASQLAFLWLVNNQNSDGSWYSKYKDLKVVEKNRPTHFGPYISVAALHYYKIFKDLKFLEILWPTIELAINFAINIQSQNGAIPWSVDKDNVVENDFLLTGCSSILKSIECGIAISKILKKQSNISVWSNSYILLSNAIKNPSGKFDKTKDRKHFSMDWYYPIISGCLNDDEIIFYINKIYEDFYVKDIGVKCVKHEPWVTVAETCEFIISLMIAGRINEAQKILFDIVNISDEKHIPFMGWQYKENMFWPDEKPAWTSAALIISADTIYGYTDASNLFTKKQSNLY